MERESIEWAIRNEVIHWLQRLHNKGCERVKDVPMIEIENLTKWATDRIIQEGSSDER